MTINRSIWKRSFNKENVPEWHCPACKIGLLELKEDSLSFSETPKSKEWKQMDDWEPDWTQYSYIARFVCNNKKCRGEVSSSGYGTIEMYIEYDNYGQPIDVVYFDSFAPENFSPPLFVFQIPEHAPELVSKAIRSSFGLYFCSPESALNHVRASVENLLTEEGIKRFSKNSRKYIALHHRIEIYEKKNPKVGKHLLALKNLGNAGSHNTSVTKDDVLDAYSILEVVLNELYSNQSRKEVEKIVKHVNRGKGPIKNRTVIAQKRRTRRS